MNKRNRTHWSRKPDQIRRDTEFLRKAGIVFEKTPSGFNQMRSAELKDKLVDRLIEAKFEGENDLEHQQAKKIWDENFGELKGA